MHIHAYKHPGAREPSVHMDLSCCMTGKVAAALKELEDCRACPRNCGVNRLNDEMGVCNVGRKVIVSTIARHFAEESVLQVSTTTSTAPSASSTIHCGHVCCIKNSLHTIGANTTLVMHDNISMTLLMF